MHVENASNANVQHAQVTLVLQTWRKAPASFWKLARGKTGSHCRQTGTARNMATCAKLADELLYVQSGKHFGEILKNIFFSV